MTTAMNRLLFLLACTVYSVCLTAQNVQFLGTFRMNKKARVTLECRLPEGTNAENYQVDSSGWVISASIPGKGTVVRQSFTLSAARMDVFYDPARPDVLLLKSAQSHQTMYNIIENMYIKRVEFSKGNTAAETVKDTVAMLPDTLGLPSYYIRKSRRSDWDLRNNLMFMAADHVFLGETIYPNGNKYAVYMNDTLTDLVLPIQQQFSYPFRSAAIEAGLITIPYRWNVKPRGFDGNGVSYAGLNIGLYVSCNPFVRRTFERSAKGMREVHRLKLRPAMMVGMGMHRATVFNSTVTGPSIGVTEPTEGSFIGVLSTGLGGIFEVNRYGVGLFFGRDHSLTNSELRWRFSGYRWTGLSFTYKLFDEVGGRSQPITMQN
jgi:hypothetical protein